MNTIPYSTIMVSGADAAEFLQGQLTADVQALEPDSTVLAGWCNPKGRVICLFRLRLADDGFALTLPAELAEPVCKRLTMFRFRSRVEFAIEAATAADAELDPDADDLGLLERLRAGVPEIGAGQSEKFTAHMLNLDLLGAISLTKGCYTGQEIIARTHYRGATKRRCLRFQSDAPVPPGSKVLADGRETGEVVNAIGTDLLAVVALDKADADLSAAGSKLHLQPLPYLD